MVWDVKGEYPAKHRARNPAQLVRLVRALKGKPGIIAYTYSKNINEEFRFFCQVAQTWVKSHYLVNENSVLIFEETADVTSPAKAPEEYGIILRRFLSLGVDIYALTQRPAESDKTAVGNASIVHVCRLQLARDRKAASDDTGLPRELINRLRADQEKKVFDYVTVDTGRGFYRQGVLTFPRKKPKFTPEKSEKPL